MNPVVHSRQTTLTINTKALSHNLSQVKKLTRAAAKHKPDAKILAMVKADAYGHGVANCLPALADADGVGVASFSEAKQVRLLGWSKAIVMIEGAFSKSEWQQAQKFECACVIHHACQLEWALTHRPDNDSPTNTIWLKINTGMNRLGFAPSHIVDVAKKLHKAGYQIILTSHFANADDKHHPLNKQQINTFSKVLTTLKDSVSTDIKGSLCNSAGLINFPEHHYDWVRPGIMLYGSTPITTEPARTFALRPVMSLSAAVMAIHEVNQGEAIGYGSRYVADKPIKKGIISIGYGDGYPRVVSDEASVAVYCDGTYHRCPLLGRVAMDMIAIDLTHVDNASIGDKVILWGDTTNSDTHSGNTHTSHNRIPSVDDVATWANTIGYELLCRITQRPDRQLL